MSDSSGDTVTVLRARNRRLAKLVRADGSMVGYDLARTVDAASVPMSSLDALWRLLARLQVRPDCCVVRGAPVGGERVHGVRRLVHRDEQTGDEPTFRNLPRRWLALDMDSIARPDDVPASDLAGCASVALASLPAAFDGVACIVQATAGHGIKPGARLRLWFMLDRPMWGHELRRWLQGTPCDMSVFGAVQPIYTAAPVFDGCRDHLPARLLFLPGLGAVPVSLPGALAAPPRPPGPPPSLHPVRASRYVRAALERAAGRIASAGEGQRHRSLFKEASGLARFVHGGLLAEADMCRVLAYADRHAGKSDDAEIASCIAWGLAHPAPGYVPALRL